MPGSSEVEDQAVPRRKRVARACETCRSMKSKCDGKRPFCSRCDGYGYRCVYSMSGRNRRGPDMDSASSTLLVSPSKESALGVPAAKIDKLRHLVGDYQGLVRDIAPKIGEPDGSRVLNSLASIDARVEDILSGLRSMNLRQADSSSVPGLPSNSLPAWSPENSQRYLGEVSDVMFFNLVNRVLQSNSPNSDHVDDNDMDSYEHDDSGDTIQASASPSPNNICANIPQPVIADTYIEIYFSTIHIAYPFLRKREFIETYLKLRDTGQANGIDKSWLATLFIIFAIGAYYLSFPGKDTSLHEHYYKYALALSDGESLDRSVGRVSCLLAQCFYLLAVCRTDRCWTTLGFAVRLAQSIGLHVENDNPKIFKGHSILKGETRRRVWYSLYVLDRLISLQLGRPPAIHDDDCHLSLPSRIDDAEIDWEDENAQLVPRNGASAGDYFLSVISLSQLIGFTLRNLYNPKNVKTATDGMLNTSSLDKQLLEWKRSLPRTLRFDLGHAFETSLTFRRQRNMLAIKFHHLRALIHRPYLCLPELQRVDDASLGVLQTEGQICAQFERTCISEAQETAHLLHNIADEKDLVHDFPWWQMISCLICASSILLVASVFPQRSRVGNDAWDFDIAALDDDAETCMKAFEALSVRSDGARLARDMMARLKQRGQIWRESGAQQQLTIRPQMLRIEEGVHASGSQPQQQPEQVVPEGAAHAQIPPSHGQGQAAFIGPEVSSDGTAAPFQMQDDWPPEIVDSMVWSAQFIGAVQDPMDSAGANFS